MEGHHHLGPPKVADAFHSFKQKANLSEPEGHIMARTSESMHRRNAITQSLDGVQVFGAALNVAAGDVHNHTTTQIYYPGTLTGRFPLGWDLVENHRQIQIATLGKATRGTCAWIRQFESWTIWLDPHGLVKIMWGSGMPGAGKTILSSIVIDVLEAYAKSSPVVVNALGPSPSKATASESQICVCYIYFRYTNHTKSTLRGLLEILVKQTIERHPRCLPLFDEVYAQHNRENTKPTEEELLRLLERLTHQMTVTFYILDALDEAPTKVQLQILQKLATLNAKLFITSRPLHTVEAHFPGAYRFPIIARGHDVELHINQEISSSADFGAILGQGGASLKAKIYASVKEKCGGMFLHASLQLEALRECTSVYEVEAILTAYSGGIEDMYRRTWNRILDQPSNKSSVARKLLLWVIYATRPLTVEEVRYATATCPETQRFEASRLVHANTLVGFCCGLVTIEEKTGVVRLVHNTAKDILHRFIVEAFPQPHALLSAFCLAQLIDCGFQQTTLSDVSGLRRALHATPLLSYAYSSWTIHAYNSLGDAAATILLRDFIVKCSAFPVLLPRHSRWLSAFDVLSPLHVTAFFGLPIAMAGAASLKNPNSTTAKKGLTALHLACLRGNTVAVTLLLHFRDISVNTADASGSTPLLLASELGYETVIGALLAHPKIDVNGSDGSGRTPLIIASVQGHGGNVKLLLSHPRINVNLPNSQRYTALLCAVLNDHEAIVDDLLSHRQIDIDSAKLEGLTVLMRVSIRGYEGAVQKLLANPQLDVNQVDRRCRTALHRVSQLGRERIVQLLLSHPHINVNLADSTYGQTALSVASEAGHEGTVKVLLSHPKVDVNAVDGEGQTPLSWAAEAGHAGTMALFLAHPMVDVNAQDKQRRTALGRASGQGYLELVKLLLAHPLIDVNVVDTLGNTALSRASEMGNESIVKLLLSHSGIRVGTRELEAARRGAERAIIHVEERRHIVTFLECFMDRANIYHRD